MDTLRRPSAVAALLAVAVTAGAAPPDPAAPLPARNRALLLLRVLVYDRNLPLRGAGDVVVAVAYLPGDTASEADRDAVLAAMVDVSREVVAAGRSVTARAVPFRSEPDLAARLGDLGAAAVYACSGLEASAPGVAAAARRARALSFGASRALVDGGLAIGLLGRGRRAAVVVSLAAARAEGADLDAALLAVAEVVGTAP